MARSLRTVFGPAPAARRPSRKERSIPIVGVEQRCRCDVALEVTQDLELRFPPRISDGRRLVGETLEKFRLRTYRPVVE
jgi:hypothetical protein